MQRFFYTTDGSAPTAQSTEYTAAITIDTLPMTVKAIAVKEGMKNSKVATAEYIEKQTVVTPVLSVEEGAVVKGTSLEITCETEGAKIYYTTDGSDPTAESTEYTAAISIVPPMTVKAIAVKDEMNDSTVASASYTFKAKYAIGDIVLKDGTVCKPADYEEGSDTAAAVIFRGDTASKSALGVGVVQSELGLDWAVTGSKGNNNELTKMRSDKGYVDGSNSWELLKEYCDDAEAHPENYPAFKYSLDYGTTNNLSETIASGWYMPTLTEIEELKSRRGTVEATLTTVGAETYGERFYWTCNQDTDRTHSCKLGNFKNTYGGSCRRAEGTTYVYTCSIRAFD